MMHQTIVDAYNATAGHKAMPIRCNWILAEQRISATPRL